MRECQSVSELSIREVSDGRERVERAAPPVTRGHGLALDGAGLTLGRPKIIAKLSQARLNFGTQRYLLRPVQEFREIIRPVQEFREISLPLGCERGCRREVGCG